jgi:hypothetical protein
MWRQVTSTIGGPDPWLAIDADCRVEGSGVGAIRVHDA